MYQFRPGALGWVLRHQFRLNRVFICTNIQWARLGKLDLSTVRSGA